MLAVAHSCTSSTLQLHAPFGHEQNASRYLYNDVPCESIDDNVLLPQGQCRYYFFPKLLDVPLNLPYSSLMEIAAAFGKVVNWQLL